MKAALLLSVVLVPTLALAAGPQWIWEAGKQSSNGSITIKSTNGSTTYTGTQNPTGAVAKTNQNAVTQPPTVIIQATGGGLPFNYKDDCWIFDLTGYAGSMFIGAGKVDTVTSKFTGIMGYAMASGGYYNGGGQVMAALTGAGYSGQSTYGSGNPYWCGADVGCAWNYSSRTGSVYGSFVVIAAALPILTYQKCYP